MTTRVVIVNMGPKDIEVVDNITAPVTRIKADEVAEFSIWIGRQLQIKELEQHGK